MRWCEGRGMRCELSGSGARWRIVVYFLFDQACSTKILRAFYFLYFQVQLYDNGSHSSAQVKSGP